MSADNPASLLIVMKTEESSKKHEVVFFIDRQQFKSDQDDLTVRTLLVDFAKEDPSQTTLATKHGNDLYKSRRSHPHRERDEIRCATQHSDTGIVIFGPDRLIAELSALGYVVERVAVGAEVFAVIRDYEVLVGIFAGRVIDLGLQCTADFPRSVHSAIHVRAEPQLLEKSDTIPNVRNIIDSPLGSDWRYWSNNFGWSGNDERSARRLMSQINTIFERA